jgi:hypothetical protein
MTRFSTVTPPPKDFPKEVIRAAVRCTLGIDFSYHTPGYEQRMRNEIHRRIATAILEDREAQKVAAR